MSNTRTGTVGVQRHILRIMRDIQEFKEAKDISMDIYYDEENITTIHALIRGSKDTPYQNGFFYFKVQFPTDYPLKPPQVKLMTTGGQTVRFNPNLYRDGFVCLSILGTFAGPGWSPVHTLLTVLQSIQTLVMNEKPYHNEPGYEDNTRRGSGSLNVLNYSQMIEYETIRVAVVGMLEEYGVDSRNMPQQLKQNMISFFRSNYQYYEQFVVSKQHLDGKPITDPFRDKMRPKRFEYKNLLKKLIQLKEKYPSNDEQTGGQALPTPTDSAIEATYDDMDEDMYSDEEYDFQD